MDEDIANALIANPPMIPDPVAKILAGFYKSFPGYLVSLTGADKNQENITLHVGSPGIRGEYYIWEKNDGGARYLFSQQEKIDSLSITGIFLIVLSGLFVLYRETQLKINQ